MITLNNKRVIATVFPDQTCQVWKLDSILPNNNYVVWWYENDGEIVTLAQLSLLVGRTSWLKIPFLPYGRQDKEVSNSATFGLHAFANIMNSMYWSYIHTHDVHSNEAFKVKALYNVPPMLDLSKFNTVIFPDNGAYKRYVERDDLLCNFYGKVVIGDKVREQSTGFITSYELNDKPVGECLVIDDICDGGATFKILADSVLTKHNVKLHLYVTHGLFSKGLSVLDAYSTIHTTNSCYGGIELQHNNVRMLHDLAKQSPWWKEFVQQFAIGRLQVINIY